MKPSMIFPIACILIYDFVVDEKEGSGFDAVYFVGTLRPKVEGEVLRLFLVVGEFTVI